MEHMLIRLSSSILDQADDYREQCCQVRLETLQTWAFADQRTSFRITQGKHPLVEQCVDDLQVPIVHREKDEAEHMPT